ncbi:MAG: RDD family protein [Planctomycetota bacterium]
MPRYRITTPEHVHFHYDVAGLSSRAMGWLVDQGIMTVLRITLVIGLGGAGALGVMMILILWFGIDFGYFVFFELRWQGQSPGKRLFHVRVISADGARLRFDAVLIRNLLRWVDSLPAGMLIGGVVAFLDPLHRRLGDLAAETLVIRDARRAIPDAVLKQQSRVNTYQADPAVRSRILARVTREERDLILDMVIRRDDLDPAVREDLFEQAAGYFRRRLNLPDDLEHLSSEQAVINLALVIQEMKFG